MRGPRLLRPARLLQLRQPFLFLQTREGTLGSVGWSVGRRAVDAISAGEALANDVRKNG